MNLDAMKGWSRVTEMAKWMVFEMDYALDHPTDFEMEFSKEFVMDLELVLSMEIEMVFVTGFAMGLAWETPLGMTMAVVLAPAKAQTLAFLWWVKWLASSSAITYANSYRLALMDIQ
jgi:phenolic acid decarboxylase